MTLETLSTWKRESLIDWLATNDRNGIYTDAESEAEGLEPLTKKEAITIVLSQLAEA